ncbi:hypothetical protein RJ639_005254 [Escallonia herrerae]|uniref:Uncharacterized protein n=1 Tax=Escallonia herrerae TaxID=1293975 RepID=A0AA89B313_9ASTE|nr:hypothetical protein RJ639_005254 [Escallonia herrerae]
MTGVMMGKMMPESLFGSVIILQPRRRGWLGSDQLESSYDRISTQTKVYDACLCPHFEFSAVSSVQLSNKKFAKAKKASTKYKNVTRDIWPSHERTVDPFSRSLFGLGCLQCAPNVYDKPTEDNGTGIRDSPISRGTSSISSGLFGAPTRTSVA